MSADTNPSGWKLNRRDFLKLIGLASASTVVAWATRSSAVVVPNVLQGKDEDQTVLEIKHTKFNKVMTEVANQLSWRVRTAPIGSDTVTRCLSFNDSVDWLGCISAFKGFETPQRPEGFQPSGYLVYGYGDYLSKDDSGQRLFVYPKPIEGLPINSTSKTFENLLTTFEEQRDISRKFGFKFPETEEEYYRDTSNSPREETGVIGYWGLSKQEFSKIGVIHMRLP